MQIKRSFSVVALLIAFGSAKVSVGQTQRWSVNINNSPVSAAGARRLLSVPPNTPIYQTYLTPKNTLGSPSAALKVLDGKSGIGTGVVLNAPATTSTELFTVMPDGEIQLSSQVNGKTLCLDVAGAHYADEASVITWPCNGQANQKWNFVAKGDDYYAISPIASPSYCLDVKADGTAVNTPITLYSCWGGDNQSWTLVSGG